MAGSVLTVHTEPASSHLTDFFEKKIWIREKGLRVILQLACYFQEYCEWKKGVADVCVPTVYLTRMDHLNSYVQVVTDATDELCDLILSSYREKLNLIWENGRCISFQILHLKCSGSLWQKYLKYLLTDCN